MKSKKSVYYAILFFVYVHGKAQENFTTLAGIDLGYASYPKYLDYKGEINLNGVFVFKRLMLNANFGIAPFTNAGAIKKTSVLIGFTTKLSRQFSWHFLVGGMTTQWQKEYVKDQYNQYHYFSVRGPCFNTGFYCRIKQSKFLIGFNVFISYWKDDIYYGTPGVYLGHGSYSWSNGYYFSPNLSLNYLLKFKKNGSN